MPGTEVLQYVHFMDVFKFYPNIMHNTGEGDKKMFFAKDVNS